MPTLDEKTKELIKHLDLLFRRFLINQKEATGKISNLTRQEFRVIITLGRLGSCKMSQIADEMMLAISSVTFIVDNLVAKKLVQRTRMEEDRRVVNVELTSQGKSIYRMAYDKKLKMGFGILKSLNETEQNKLIELFRKVTDKLRNQNEDK